MSTRKLRFHGTPQNLPDHAQVFADLSRQRIQFFVSHCLFLFERRSEDSRNQSLYLLLVLQIFTPEVLFHERIFGS